jgi:hypothetical protein
MDTGDNGWITKETIHYPLTIGHHAEYLKLHVIRMATSEIILGMKWLEKHDPVINFAEETLSFLNKKCMSYIGMEGTKHKEIRSLVSITTEQIKQFEENNKILKQPLEENIYEIPTEYQDLREAFSDPKGLEALPEYQPWDLEIKTLEGARLPSLPLYKSTYKQ